MQIGKDSGIAISETGDGKGQKQAVTQLISDSSFDAINGRLLSEPWRQ